MECESGTGGGDKLCCKYDKTRKPFLSVWELLEGMNLSYLVIYSSVSAVPERNICYTQPHMNIILINVHLINYID